MFSVKDVETVKNLIEKNFAGYRLGSERVRIEDLLSRIAAEDIYAPEDIPGFDRSTVDGYAVRAADTFGASESIPSALKLMSEVKIGEDTNVFLHENSAAYVPTGGKLPQNADAVVMIEYTENMDDGYIYINKSVSPGNNIIFKGDDAKTGYTIIKQNTLLKPKDIGALAAAGISEISAKKKIVTGIISTGDEIADISEPLIASKVRDVNSYTLYTGLKELGGNPVMYGIVPDSFNAIKTVVEEALRECDIVLISGGSSVGTLDMTCKVIESFGTPGIFVHGIAIKPGKPTIIAKVFEKAVFGLPGHPVSAYFIFKIFVGHLFNIINKYDSESFQMIRAYTAFNYPSNDGREEYVPVKIEKTVERLLAFPVFTKSGLINTLTKADGYIKIARGAEGVVAGQEITVYPF